MGIYSVVILPIMAMRFYRKESPLSDRLCHMYPVLYYTVQGASLFSLTMVTLNRAAMLFIPSMVDKLFTNTKLIRGKHFPLNSFIILLVCWLIPLFGLFPTILGKNGCLGLQHTTQSCTILHDSKGHSPKSMMYSIVVAIPTITIIATDIAIYFKMSSIQKADVRMSVTVVDERKMEKKFMMMLATILFIFFLTYMPGFVIKSLDSCYGWPTTHAVAYVFNWASVWLNPIVYVVGQKKYQEAVKHLFGRFDLQRRNTKQFIPSINLSGTGGTGSDPKTMSSSEVVGEDNRQGSLLSKSMTRVKERVSFGNTDSTTDGSGSK